MRIARTLGGATALLIAMSAGSAFGQDAKAAEVLAKTRQALGGAKLDALKSLSLAATTHRNVGQMQMTSDVEIAMEMPDKYLRSEASRGGMMSMTMNSGFNGDNAILPANASFGGGGMMIVRVGPGGPVSDGPTMTDEQRAELNKVSLRTSRAELSRMMLGWFGMAHPLLHVQYTYAGEAESPDGKAHVIDVKDAEGFEARLFIDQNNYLPLMVTYKGRQPRVVTQRMPGAAGHGASSSGTSSRPLSDDERRKLQQDAEAQVRREAAEQPLVDFSLFFDDWREIDGINFPHALRRAVAGETTEEWTIDKVKVNPKLDPKKFAVNP
jgi:hypothetical protein